MRLNLIIQQMPQENWKRIEGFSNYEVSDLGRVRSERGTILKRSIDYKGFCRVNMKWDQDGKKHDRRIHILVAKAFLDKPLAGQKVVTHINDMRDDNRACNLRWSSLSQDDRAFGRKRGIY